MQIGIPKPSSLPEMPQEQNAPQESPEQTDLKLPSAEEVILNYEQRIQALEAAFMRIRGAI